MKRVVFLMPGREFSYRFLGCWTDLLFSLPKLGVAPLSRFGYIPNVYDVRNLLLEGRKFAPLEYKPFGGKLDYDYLMWIDSDQVWMPEQFAALYNRMEKDPTLHIVSGCYVKEDGDLSLAVDWESSPDGKTQYLHYDEVPKLPSKFMKVPFAGMGFMLVRRGVFEALKYPWFEPLRFQAENGGSTFSGEDAAFGIKAARAGFPTWVDLDVIIGHEKVTVLGWAPTVKTKEMREQD